jgi:hypothetical protein
MGKLRFRKFSGLKYKKIKRGESGLFYATFFCRVITATIDASAAMSDRTIAP